MHTLKEVECPAVPHFQDLSKRRLFFRAIEAVWHHTLRDLLLLEETRMGSCGRVWAPQSKHFIRSSIALWCRFNSINARWEHDLPFKRQHYTLFVNHFRCFMALRLTFTDILGPIVRTFDVTYPCRFFKYCFATNGFHIAGEQTCFSAIGFFVIWQAQQHLLRSRGIERTTFCLVLAATMFYDIWSLLNWTMIWLKNISVGLRYV